MSLLGDRPGRSHGSPGTMLVLNFQVDAKSDHSNTDLKICPITLPVSWLWSSVPSSPKLDTTASILEVYSPSP